MLKEIKSYYKKVNCIKISSKNFVLVDENTELWKVIKIMHFNNVDTLPVVNNQKKLIGILSIFDLILDVQRFIRRKIRIPRAASHQKGKKTGFGVGELQSILKFPVHNIVKHYPMIEVCSPYEKVSEVIDKLINKDVCSLVIVKNDLPIGIITSRDILLDFTKTL